MAGGPGPTDRVVDVSARPPRPSPWKIFAGAVILLSAGIIGFILFRSHSPGADPIPGGAPASGESLRRSVARIPLRCRYDRGIDHLSWATIGELRVISRTSVMTYKLGRAQALCTQIARELNVDAVVEGTLLHSGNSIRITAQLILAANDEHLWGTKLRKSSCAMYFLDPEAGGLPIAEQVRIKLNPTEQTQLSRPKAANSEAYEAYLKGRYFWNKRTADGLRKGIDYFQSGRSEWIQSMPKPTLA